MKKKRLTKRLPGGRTVLRIKARKPSKPKCGKCGTFLHGVARGTNMQRKNMSKSAKRPERAYGGVLCSKCSRLTIRRQVRESQ